MIELIPGQVIARREIHAQIGGQQRGGISTPATQPVVLLFSGEQGAQYGYYDGFQPGGEYWYTGEGQVGNMTLTRGNSAIQRHRAEGKGLLLFEYVRKGVVQFVGAAEYLNHHPAVAPDRNGNARDVLVFELDVEASRKGIPNVQPETPEPVPPTLRRRSLESLRKEAYNHAPRNGLATLSGSRISHYRSGLIKAYVLKRADGTCEGCGNPAPFSTSKGMPYLEPHHLTRRADGGPDHPRWVVALCPNCHARVHRGSDGCSYNIELAQRVASIEDRFE